MPGGARRRGPRAGCAGWATAVNLVGDGNLDGWAIPIATDIAFALATLGVVEGRAPAELRTFMLTLGIVDDLATIAVIAVFNSGDSRLPGWAAACWRRAPGRPPSPGSLVGRSRRARA